MIEHPPAELPTRSSAQAPQPLTLLTEADAYALAGGPAAARDDHHVGGATVVIGDAGTVVVVAAGDRPGGSGVWNAEEVRIVGPAPAPVRQRLLDPLAERGATGTESPVHLLARVPEGSVLYLGTGRVTQAGTTLPPGSPEAVLTDCAFRLETPLSASALARVRPPLPAPELPGVEWLGEVNGDRASALARFLTTWYPPTPPGGTTPPSPPGLPRPLRHFHELAHDRPLALGTQNALFPPVRLRTDPDGTLDIGTENQGIFTWSLRRPHDSPDPTVWFETDDGTLVPEAEPLSGFLLQFALYEAATSADYLALPHEPTPEQIERLTRDLHPVPLAPFLPSYPTRFYVAPGLVLHLADAGDGYISAWAGATHRAALAPLTGTDTDWHRFDG
ncbi:hypothetical protein ABZX40_26145 [Streptomyces sp. NPDC004610]|uniref:hypothetical protein n=1 Tax=unclassified Streptomyces TaxID=2593676 RepID=UPI0033BABD25